MRWATAIAFVAALCGVALASPGVFVSPAEMIVEEGDSFTMSIRVDAGTDTVTCFLVDFVFDANVIQLTSAEEGSLFANCGYGTMFDWDTIGPGSHSCNDVTLGYWAYTICPGEIVTLHFEAVSWGDTCIDIVAADLRDLRRDPILPLETTDGHVTVNPLTGVDNTPGVVGRLAVAPNPFAGDAMLAFSEPLDIHGARLFVYDVAGRIVRRWDLSECGPEGGVLWDGTDGSGAPQPSGVYFAVARGPGWERRARVVLVR